jgi:excisionase family DNA binding protein
MHHRLQSGMRENPASNRRHGPRQAPRNLSGENCEEKVSAASQPLTTGPDHPLVDGNGYPHAASPPAATGGEKIDAATAHTVAITPGSPVAKMRDFEPLIGSSQAAQLLGNIHVKTLQRYARRGLLPGYQIGGHWYFRASELDAWLHSRINSNCHPCRLK